MNSNENLINELNNINIPEVDYFPIDNNIFRVFRKPLSEVKVVILGQDPKKLYINQLLIQSENRYSMLSNIWWFRSCCD